MRQLATREKVMLGGLALAAIVAWWGAREGGMGFGNQVGGPEPLLPLEGEAPLVRVELGSLLYSMGECTELHELLALHNGTTELWLKALCHERLGNVGSAHRLYVQLVERDPRNPRFRARLDQVERRMGQILGSR